jgi:uncharacterized membrane protein YheB (UPF0754 family)
MLAQTTEPALSAFVGSLWYAVYLLSVPGLEAVSSLLADFELRLLVIPPITGIIGYITNWVGIRLMFNPIEFRGFKIPGMDQLSQFFPRRVQQIPGMMEGKFGWQGIVPSRASKMGSIAYDNSIEKVASQREFYRQFDPDVVAQYVVQEGKDDIHRLVDDILRTEYPDLWEDAPEAVKGVIHEHVESRLPELADRLFEKTGENINDLMNVKMMIINHLDANPKLLNRMFLEVGDKELKFLVNSGFIFGTLLGFISIPLYVYIDQWWVLPVSGALVGYMTNFIAIKAIFNPIEEYKVGPFRIQGLFIKRQEESVDKYSSIVAKEVLTVGNIARHLLYGPKSDRTRKMIRDSLLPEIDRSVGAAQPIVRATTGDESYEAMREALATEPIEYGYELLKDPEFNRERSIRMKELIAKEMKKLPPEEYVLMLRPAFEEDEWLLIAVGAVLGFVAGWIQLLVVTGL